MNQHNNSTSSKIFYILFFLASIIAGMMVSQRLLYDNHSLGGINFESDRQNIEERARSVLRFLEIDVPDWDVVVSFRQKPALLRQAQQELGFAGANQALREHLPGFYWNVRVIPGISFFELEDDIRRNHPELDSEADQARVADLVAGIGMHFNSRGELIRYENSRLFEEDISGIDEPGVEAFARKFLENFTPYPDLGADTVGLQLTKVNNRPNEAPGDTSSAGSSRFTLDWEIDTPRIDGETIVSFVLDGARLKHFSTRHNVPAKYDNEVVSQFQRFLHPIMMILIAVFTMVFAVRRWGAGEVEFKRGIVLGIIIFITFMLNLATEIEGLSGAERYFGIFIAALFFGGAMVFVWAVGESIGREVWREKFISFDLLTNGYWLHSRIGYAIINGIGFGVVALALWLIGMKWVTALFPETGFIIKGGNAPLGFISSDSPTATFLVYVIFSITFVIPIYYLLMLSVMRRWIRSMPLLIGIWAFLIAYLYKQNIEPVTSALLVELPFVILLGWVFSKYDLMTVIIAASTHLVAEGILVMNAFGHPNFEVTVYTLISMLALSFIYGGVTLFAQDRITDFQRIAPSYTRNISERERLARELEIARDVQMSFLPAASPDFVKLDIASRCVPALEVGGDYYDFIPLGRRRLGISVGDVSGKGTQAAFYMTLTKGFLRALADDSTPPTRVMSKINSLFYENAKRGVFISMIYSVFDTEQSMVSFARAGHNPILVYRNESHQLETIYPKGLALGMARAKEFDGVIQEARTQFRTGDVFVLYTDGLTEAMNRRREEFGEDRLSQSLEKYAFGSADDILHGLIADVQAFTGRAPQHDDMTLVVVKIEDERAING